MTVDMMKKIQIRNQKVEDLKFEITKRMNQVGDFELMVDDIQGMITKAQVKLFNKELVEITNIFYSKGEQTIERLDLSDRFYAEIDHANSGLLGK